MESPGGRTPKTLSVEQLKPYFYPGHQGDYDWTQIDSFLRLTPTERLHKHEEWRQFWLRHIASECRGR